MSVVYRGVLAEVRRSPVDDDWAVAGIVVGGAWHPAAQGIEPASRRLVEAGIVDVVELPAFLATSDEAAPEVALDVAAMRGYHAPSPAQTALFREQGQGRVWMGARAAARPHRGSTGR